MKYSTFVVAAAAGTAAAASAPAYGQCGGQGWTGATACVSGYHCAAQNNWYSQCVPGAGSSAPQTTKVVTSVKPTTTKAATSIKATTTAAASKAPVTTAASRASTTSKAATSSVASSKGKVKYAGVNIAGFDFGIDTNGGSGTYQDPGTTGQSQMNHFVKDDKLNAFRLPVGWQYLVGNTLGGNLDSSFFSKYDAQVTYCLNSGAELCIIDLHNYARWNGAIVGSSGGPTNAQFASVWSQLATKYASKPKVAFGIMNEPHDLQDINTWATTVQAAVTAIRKAGATQNLILLPGNDWTHAAQFVDNGSAAALNKITNLDGSKTNLVFDVHQYSDSDGSGTNSACTTDNVAGFTTLATWLRANGRQAILTEAGGSNDQSCLTNVCTMLNYLMTNSDVYLGWTGWSAGMFASNYVLSEVPTGSAGSYTDQAILTKCIAGVFNSK
ncbi:cellulase-domain-containing protein [Aureobasidium pullulans]|uniref:Endoglucanase EG-II n=1 Tax=Aureobasidium pullulans TaxID=5580 RepID=A0A4S8T5Q5_AURPU|nr:cellulase-domain-containing protein [Aureobasidium pullulans]TIA27937.1 cellulase-domain-containing protein [Aureobasidium pullulans]TIA75485.1 cellulase-domain-containing protein [Aureobasidium pullulans]